jgi:hypothetical protein
MQIIQRSSLYFNYTIFLRFHKRLFDSLYGIFRGSIWHPSIQTSRRKTYTQVNRCQTQWLIRGMHTLKKKVIGQGNDRMECSTVKCFNKHVDAHEHTRFRNILRKNRNRVKRRKEKISMTPLKSGTSFRNDSIDTLTPSIVLKNEIVMVTKEYQITNYNIASTDFVGSVVNISDVTIEAENVLTERKKSQLDTKTYLTRQCGINQNDAFQDIMKRNLRDFIRSDSFLKSDYVSFDYYTMSNIVSSFEGHCSNMGEVSISRKNSSQKLYLNSEGSKFFDTPLTDLNTSIKDANSLMHATVANVEQRKRQRVENPCTAQSTESFHSSHVKNSEEIPKECCLLNETQSVPSDMLVQSNSTFTLSRNGEVKELSTIPFKKKSRHQVFKKDTRQQLVEKASTSQKVKKKKKR